MKASESSGNEVFGRFTEPAHQVLDLAREEAERCGHRYLGPEHVLLGLLAEGHSRAARALWAAGVDLVAARAALARLADRGVVPAPRPSDAELLGALGIDLVAVRRDSEQAHALGHSQVRPEHLLLLAALEVDPDRPGEAVAAQLGGIRR
jgi:ATP-dependent Clp protease ATP-binding subunit ClpC